MALYTLGRSNYGGILTKGTTSERDAISSPSSGDTHYNTSTNQLNIYANGSWNEFILTIPTNQVALLSGSSTSTTLLAGAGSLNGTGSTQGTATESDHQPNNWINFKATKAFNGTLTNSSDYWGSDDTGIISSSNPKLITFEFPNDVAVGKYKIWPRAQNGQHNPKTWKLFAYLHNSGTPVEIDSRTEENWNATSTSSVINDTDYNEYTTNDNATKYGKFELNITDTHDPNKKYVKIGELAFYGPGSANNNNVFYKNTNPYNLQVYRNGWKTLPLELTNGPSFSYGLTIPSNSSGNTGNVFYNTTNNSLYLYRNNEWISIFSRITDTTAPTISANTQNLSGNDNTPSFTFTSNEAGTIITNTSDTFSPTQAISGSNTITFNTLAYATYNINVSVEDTANNVSNVLTIPSFTISSSAGVGSGGNESTYSNYKVYSFLASSTFTVTNNSITVDILIVGGGAGGYPGGSGAWEGGGGGAGELIFKKNLIMSVGAYTITVGAGGGGLQGQSTSDGVANTANGNPSQITGQGLNNNNGYTASGGGTGSRGGGNAEDGGSGGGSGHLSTNSSRVGNASSGTPGVPAVADTSDPGSPDLRVRLNLSQNIVNQEGHFAYSGGYKNSNSNIGGGGGGAHYHGNLGTTISAGGPGKQYDIRTGSVEWYAGGGGGGARTGTNVPGGVGGGGYGASTSGGGPADGGPGTANTGGGGGGSVHNNGYPIGGNGGSGIVVIRYVI